MKNDNELMPPFILIGMKAIPMAQPFAIIDSEGEFSDIESARARRKELLKGETYLRILVVPKNNETDGK